MTLPFPIVQAPEPPVAEAARKVMTGQIDFLKGVVAMEGLPAPDRIEVCFAGRSNAGKLSLIHI